MDKNLTDADWKRFAKGRGYKDAGLLKAWAALDKLEKAEPKDQLVALDELGKQAGGLRKEYKADKELTAFLNGLDEWLKAERKRLEEAQKAAEAKAKEDEDSPALLSSKLISMLREVRKGTVGIKALVALAGKDAAVVLARSLPGSSVRKLLVAELGGASGVRYVPGECVFEAKAYTFVVESQATGLAKKLKAALLRQTKQLLKVRVRGVDPNDVDEDLEGSDQLPEDDAAPPSGPTDADPGAAFKGRLTALLPAIQQAVASKRPEGEAAKLKASEAGMWARKGRFDQGLRLLDEVERLLKPAAPKPVKTAAEAAAATGIRAGTVDYAKCRLAWSAAKSKVHADLQKLEQAILAEFSGVPAFEVLSQGVRKFDTVLEGFADDLGDVLDDALNATDDGTRTLHHRKAAQIIAKFQKRAASDPFIAKLQKNPFVPINVQQTLLGTLDVLAKRLN